MDNTREFKATLDLWTCHEGPKGEPSTASGETALNELAKALRAYGIDVDVKPSRSRRSATIKIGHAEPWRAERARTRNAGRYRTTTWPAESGRTDAERLAWCESLTTDELAEALGCSRRTAQRRLAELRAKVR